VSTITATSPPTATTSRSDSRTVRRVVSAILLPLGPLSVAALRGILPYFHASDSHETITHTAAGLGRQDGVLWLSVLALVTLIPACLAAARLAQPRSPVLSMLALGLLVPAFAALPFFANDPTIRVLAGGSVDTPTAARLLDDLNGLAPVSVAGAIFIAGHVLGMSLLGVALWRARVVPVWAALAVIVAQPLHFLSFVVLHIQPADACAWGLNALGFAAVALRVLRTPNDAWDLPAATR
jgi:hypothetical protein